MIYMGELTSFIGDMADGEQERLRWEYYLARVYDKDYSDWISALDARHVEAVRRSRDEGMTQEQIIEQTMRIAAISRKEV